MREQRAVKVVGHDDRIETLAGERPRSAFEVAYADGNPRNVRQCCEGIGIAIDGDDLRATRGEKSSVPTLARGKIQHARGRWDQMSEAHDPGRRPRLVLRSGDGGPQRAQL